MGLVLTMRATFKAVQADVKVATATYATVVVRYLHGNSLAHHDADQPSASMVSMFISSPVSRC